MDDCKFSDCRWLLFGINLFVVMAITSALQKEVMDSSKFDAVGCLSPPQKFVLSSFFHKYDAIVDSKFEDFLTKDFQLIGSSNGLPDNKSSYTPKLSIITRDLDGEGSHRQLVTSIVFDIDSASFWQHFKYCKMILLERLPLGIFSDAFELQRLVQHGVFSDAAVFGDTNLELPSALSNQSIVEIHMDIRYQMLSSDTKVPDLTIVLPLHVRYPPLDSNRYWNVQIEAPDLLISCTPTTSSLEGCSSLLFRFYPSNITDVLWKIPCGNGEHSFVISVVTFASALVSALLIVYSSISSLKKDAKLA